jgi:2-C-methyl-D-erythritol 2,4-cyclodiphosphate synthase
MGMRIGYGYDVHRLVKDRALVLGGVELQHEYGLLGHSDADVLCHAISDALLGAAALGDIGVHFPDTDPQYRGASSLTLLQHVVRLLQESGFGVGNVDATVVLQRPRLSPHMDAMRHALANAMDVDVGCVSVKATTTEGLGSTGREEGIAAHAVALIESHQPPSKG